MFDYIVKRFTKIVIRIILLLFFLGLLLLTILYSNYKNSTIYPYPNRVFDYVEDHRSDIYLNEKNKKYLEDKNIWSIRLDGDGNVIESFNKPDEVKEKFEMTDVVRFTRYYLNDYPVFTYIVGDGLIVFAYPKNSLDKLPINFIDYNHFIFNFKIVLTFVFLFLFFVYFMYKIDIRNIFKMLNPIQEAIEHLFEDDYQELDEFGELTELSKAINDANKEYLELKDAQAKWIRGISHDVRTPLAKISWGLSEIEEQSTTEIKMLQSQVIKISNIIEDLNLAMSLRSLKKENFTLQNPVSILRKLVVEQLNENPTREIYFDNRLDDIKINIDCNLFYRMLENILKNSLLYTEGSITVSAYTSGDKVCIAVEDEGEGISETLLKQVQESDISHVTTHGLGIFISKQIAEIQGGDFLIENIYPGVRVLFTFN